MNNKSILVTIIIPTYKRFDSLFRAIESAHNQTYQNIEIIVVDDNYGNEHLRLRIKKKLSVLDYNVQYLLPEKHLGSALTRNLGIKCSNGEYIAFLDDDDVYHPQKIEKQLNMMLNYNNSKLALLYCYGKIIYPNGQVELETTDVSGIQIAKHMKNNIAGTSFWLCLKSALLAIGGFEMDGAHDDGVVILKLMANGYCVDLVREYLVDYYVHNYDNGITGITYTTLAADVKYFEICKKYFDLISKEEARSVTSYYFDDRNWNLIVLNEIKLSIYDIGKMAKENVYFTTIIKCIFRIVFHRTVLAHEKKRLLSKGLE